MAFVLDRFLGKPDGTYDRETGDPKVYKDGYSVSIHQNQADGKGCYKSHVGRYKSIYDYRSRLMKIALKYKMTVDVGVCNHEIEVSLWTKEEALAQMLAQKYNQYAYYDHAQKCMVLNPEYSPNQNPIKG